MEDVFFSRHVAQIASMPPLEIAQAFTTEATPAPAIGSLAFGNSNSEPSQPS